MALRNGTATFAANQLTKHQLVYELSLPASGGYVLTVLGGTPHVLEDIEKNAGNAAIRLQALGAKFTVKGPHNLTAKNVEITAADGHDMELMIDELFDHGVLMRYFSQNDADWEKNHFIANVLAPTTSKATTIIAKGSSAAAASVAAAAMTQAAPAASTKAAASAPAAQAAPAAPVSGKVVASPGKYEFPTSKIELKLVTSPGNYWLEIKDPTSAQNPLQPKYLRDLIFYAHAAKTTTDHRSAGIDVNPRFGELRIETTREGELKDLIHEIFVSSVQSKLLPKAETDAAEAALWAPAAAPVKSHTVDYRFTNGAEFRFEIAGNRNELEIADFSSLGLISSFKKAAEKIRAGLPSGEVLSIDEEGGGTLSPKLRIKTKSEEGLKKMTDALFIKGVKLKLLDPAEADVARSKFGLPPSPPTTFQSLNEEWCDDNKLTLLKELRKTGLGITEFDELRAASGKDKVWEFYFDKKVNSVSPIVIEHKGQVKLWDAALAKKQAAKGGRAP